MGTGLKFGAEHLQSQFDEFKVLGVSWLADLLWRVPCCQKFPCPSSSIESDIFTFGPYWVFQNIWSKPWAWSLQKITVV